MARLTPTDKQALLALSRRGWIQSPEERRPNLSASKPVSIEAYCRWVAFLSRLPHAPKPVRFIGSHWKL